MQNKIKLNHVSELPLKKDQANLFLEAVTAVMVFLFSIALAGYMLVDSMAKNWQNGISGTLTVQIMPLPGDTDSQEKSLRLNKVITFFENQPAVESVILISETQKERLMSPWLGQDVDISTLPLPELLDVHLKQGADFDYEKAAQALKEIAPFASIDNHNVWLHRLLDLASSIQTLALSVLWMVLAVGVFSIFYAVCTSLGIHGQIIEILHIMGAKDDYIARQYARRGFLIGLISGAIGTAAALSAFWWLHRSAVYLSAGLLGSLDISSGGWLLLLSLPLWAALLSTATSYWAVRRTLRKIM